MASPAAKRGRRGTNHGLYPACVYPQVTITREPINLVAAETVCAQFKDVVMAPRSGDFQKKDAGRSIADVIQDFIDRAEVDATLCDSEHMDLGGLEGV